MKRLVLISWFMLIAFMTTSVDVRAAAKEKVGEELEKIIVKKMAKSATKKYIPVVNVFTTVYESTQVTMDAINMYDAAHDIIVGVTKNQPWAVAHTDVFLLGPETNSDMGVTEASALSFQANDFGDKAYCMTHVTNIAGQPVIDIQGYSKGWADWLGFGGVGLKGQVKSGSLPKGIAVHFANKIVDPYNTPIIDPSDEDSIDTEISLLEPAGFDYFLRVYYPSANPAALGPLFYEAEVFGFLGMVDEEAEELADMVQPTIYAIADYYDETGSCIEEAHAEGLGVVSLQPSDFTFFKQQITVDDETFNTFGYAFSDYTLDFDIDIPNSWETTYLNCYIHADFQAITGGRSVPEPATILLVGLGTLFLRKR